MTMVRFHDSSVVACWFAAIGLAGGIACSQPRSDPPAPTAITADSSSLGKCLGWVQEGVTDAHRLDLCSPRWQADGLPLTKDRKFMAVRGDDDRTDIRCLDDRGVGIKDSLAVLGASRSVAAMFYTEYVEDLGGGRYRANPRIPTLAALKHEAMCDDEPFAHQPRGAWCGAVLVAPGVMLMADHCIRVLPSEEQNIRKLQFFFDFVIPESGDTVEMHAENRCVPAPHHHKIRVGPHLAMMNVVCPPNFSRTPAVVREADAAPTDGEVFAIGFPLRVPAKFSGWAKVLKSHDGPLMFQADLDVFPGNSGSPVFSTDHKLVGIVEADGSDDTCKDKKRGCHHWRSISAGSSERVKITSTHDIPAVIRQWTPGVPLPETP